jgi:hypothetical protein
VERDLDLQEIPKQVPIPKKRTFISLGKVEELTTKSSLFQNAFHLFDPCVAFLIFNFKDCFQLVFHGFLFQLVFFNGGYMGDASHLHVGFHPWIFKDFNCLQAKV